MGVPSVQAEAADWKGVLVEPNTALPLHSREQVREYI